MTEGDGPSNGDGNGAGDVPLNIVDHESRERSGAANGDGSDDGDPSADRITDAAAVEERGEADDGAGEGEEVEPVELLVQLADEGEIDPWAIDIVAVTDKFLARLDGADLRTGGRALFYASVLLRMKSDHLLDDDPEPAAEEPWDAPMEGGGFEGPAVDPVEQLEAEMERRLERKRARGMPRTLDELVRELRERERESRLKSHREYDTSGSPSGFSRGTQTLDYRAADDFRMEDEPTEAEVTGTAHEEHMEDLVADVYMRLREHYDEGRDEVLYAELTAGDDAHGRVETFLALLFLAHRGQVRLEQDELFGDLWVQDPAAVASVDEAVADAD